VRMASVPAWKQRQLENERERLDKQERERNKKRDTLLEIEDNWRAGNKGLHGQDMSDFGDAGSTRSGRGLVEDERGLVEDDRGLIEFERELVEDERGLVEDERGLVEDERGLVEDERDPFDNERGLVEDERDPFDNERQSTYSAIDAYEDSDEETRNQSNFDLNLDNPFPEPPATLYEPPPPQPSPQPFQSKFTEPATLYEPPPPLQPYSKPYQPTVYEPPPPQRYTQPDRDRSNLENNNYADFIQDQGVLQEVFSVSLVVGDHISGYELRVTQQCDVERRHRHPLTMEEEVIVKGHAKPEQVYALRKLFFDEWNNIKTTMSRRGTARSDGEAIMFREGLTDRSAWFFDAGRPPGEMRNIYHHIKQFFSSYY